VWGLKDKRTHRHFDFADSVEHPVATRPPFYYAAAASPDGTLLAYATAGHLAIHDVATGKALRRVDGFPLPRSLVFAPDSRLIASALGPTIHVTEVATGKDARRWTGHIGAVTSLVFTADGRKLISGSRDTTAVVWNLTGRLSEPATWGTPLTAGELNSAWALLAGHDAGKALTTIQRLAASPKVAIAFLRDRLWPARPVGAKEIAKLIADLDSDAYTTREAAMLGLERLAELARGPCEEALKASPSPEARRRLQELLDGMAPTRPPAPEHLRIIRAVAVLEHCGTSEAWELLAALAKGAPGAPLTEEAKGALGRLRRP
jgi:hypothetical protein